MGGIPSQHWTKIPKSKEINHVLFYWKSVGRNVCFQVKHRRELIRNMWERESEGNGPDIPTFEPFFVFLQHMKIDDVVKNGKKKTPETQSGTYYLKSAATPHWVCRSLLMCVPKNILFNEKTEAMPAPRRLLGTDTRYAFLADLSSWPCFCCYQGFWWIPLIKKKKNR